MTKTSVPGMIPGSVRSWLAPVVAGGIATAALFALGLAPESPADLLLLLGLAAAGVYLAQARPALFPGARVSPALLAPMAAAVIAGAPGALLAAAPLSAALLPQRNGRWGGAALVRVASPAVTAVVVSAVCAASGSLTLLEPAAWPGGIAPGLVGAILSLAALTALDAAVTGRLRRVETPRLLREASSGVPHWLALGLMASAMGAAYRSMGMAAMAVFAVPAGIYWISSTQPVRTLRHSRRALRAAQARLAAATEETEGRERLLQRLVAAVDERCHGDPTRSARVADLAVAILGQMGIEPGTETERDLRQAALVHDVGLLFVPDEVLRKTTPLSPAERNLITEHPETAFWALAGHGLPDNALQIVRAHHERFDGRGYPNRLRSLSIPLGARILAVADAFEAMTSRRVYCDALPVEAAMQELRRGRGTQFDPQCVDACIQVVNRREQATAANARGAAA